MLDLLLDERKSEEGDSQRFILTIVNTCRWQIISKLFLRTVNVLLQIKADIMLNINNKLDLYS